MRSARRRPGLGRAALLLSVFAASAAPAAAEDLVVVTNAAFEPCLAPTLPGIGRELGASIRLVVREVPAGLDGADVVVAEDLELGRAVEGGRVDHEADLGLVPWVFVAPGGISAAALQSGAEIAVPAGAIGREARARLGALGARRVHVEPDPARLSHWPRRLVPATMAAGAATTPADVRPLVAVAARVSNSSRPDAAARLVGRLIAAGSLQGCLRPMAGAGAAGADVAGADVYGTSVVDWWLPACSLQRNAAQHNDPRSALGPPDAVRVARDRYDGIFSLGQGGWVTVQTSRPVIDGPGADVRVFQATSGEPVTLYASATASGPFVLIGLREYCGVRSTGVFANHCEFDLAGSGLGEASFLRIEDGELYPCLAGDTATEGADLDAVLVLNAR